MAIQKQQLQKKQQVVKPVEPPKVSLWAKLFGGGGESESKPEQEIQVTQQKKVQQKPKQQQQKPKTQQQGQEQQQQGQEQQQQKQKTQQQQKKQVSTSLSSPTEFHDALEQQATDAVQMAQQNVQQAHDQYKQAHKQQTKAEKTLGTQIKQSDGDLDEGILQQAYDTHLAQKQTEKAKRALQQAVKKSQQIEGILEEIRALKQQTVKHMQQQKTKKTPGTVQTGYDFSADPNNEFLHIKRPNQQITYGRKNSPEGKRFNNIPRMVFPKEVFMPSAPITNQEQVYFD